MRIVFVTNFYNHHQSELAEELYRISCGSYLLIATAEIPDERKKMGYVREQIPDYVLQSYASKETYDRCKCEIRKADVAIIGSAPRSIYYDRIRDGKLTFFYSERFKKSQEPFWKTPLRYIKSHYKISNKKNTYLLAASAYAAGDYYTIGLFQGRALKFGYFPPTKEVVDFDTYFQKKENNSILWVGRLLTLKHPESVVILANALREKGYQFKIRVIGDGEQRKTLETSIMQDHLEDYVELLGVKNPTEVRTYMEQSQIYLFTSDFQEGWGAVLNEAMNDGMCVVASTAAGSTKYLISKDEKNGHSFETENWTQMIEKVEAFLKNSDELKRTSQRAYQTITSVWNAKVAAERFWNIAQKLLECKTEAQREMVMDTYEDGPLSRAEIIFDGRSKR